jgi:hypothetical protein
MMLSLYRMPRKALDVHRFGLAACVDAGRVIDEPVDEPLTIRELGRHQAKATGWQWGEGRVNGQRLMAWTHRGGPLVICRFPCRYREYGFTVFGPIAGSVTVEELFYGHLPAALEWANRHLHQYRSGD